VDGGMNPLFGTPALDLVDQGAGKEGSRMGSLEDQVSPQVREEEG